MQVQKTKHELQSELCGAVRIWRSYWGALDDDDTEIRTRLYGFDTRSDDANLASRFFSLPDEGASFGFVAAGRVQLSDKASTWSVSAGQWFSLPNGARGVIEPKSCVVAMTRIGYNGVYAMGGPVEPKGRLRYIDGCSDSLLLAPPVIGDPCINLLHFPAGIK